MIDACHYCSSTHTEAPRNDCLLPSYECRNCTTLSPVGYDALGAQVQGIADCNLACPGNTSQSCGGAWGMQVYRFNDPPAADASHAGTVPTAPEDTDNTPQEEASSGLASPAPQGGAGQGDSSASASDKDSQVQSSMQELLQPSANLLVGPAGSVQLMQQQGAAADAQRAAKEYSGTGGAAASAVLVAVAGLLAASWSV
jgi:hypothetical protein